MVLVAEQGPCTVCKALMWTKRGCLVDAHLLIKLLWYSVWNLSRGQVQQSVQRPFKSLNNEPGLADPVQQR
jgi:hypothetical protein